MSGKITSIGLYRKQCASGDYYDEDIDAFLVQAFPDPSVRASKNGKLFRKWLSYLVEAYQLPPQKKKPVIDKMNALIHEMDYFERVHGNSTFLSVRRVIIELFQEREEGR